MPINANALSPSLVNELNDLKRRLAAVERSPDVLAKFDRYPTTEWAAIGRGRLGNNNWSSCGIANVTGLVYDRIECKFITDRFIKGRSEGELRLAAFRHFGNAQKECVSASRSLNIHGATTRQIGKGIIRWQHGIPFGWDYEDGTATYTIELQHRYLTDMTPDNPNRRQVFAMNKRENDPAASEGGATAIADGDGGFKWVAFQAGTDRSPVSYVTVVTPGDVDIWDGSYNVSNMHYCVGLSADRIPEATPDGWAWYVGGEFEYGSAGNINDPWTG